MPAWSFDRRFRRALLNGLAEAAREPPPYPELRPKRSTVRARRRDGRDPRPGQRVNVWIAQRTPGRELLGETPPISRVAIDIAHPGAVLLDYRRRLAPGVLTRIARADGFERAAEFFAFLENAHGFPFAGFLYRW